MFALPPAVRLPLSLACAGAVIGLVGCESEAAVVTRTLEPTHRTLIAVVTGETRLTKVTLKGPRLYVDGFADAFDRVIETLDTAKTPPTFAIPDGFEPDESEGRGMLRVVPETGEPVEIRVIWVDADGSVMPDSSGLYTLLNADRRALELPPWNGDGWMETAKEAGEVAIETRDDGELVRFDLVGTQPPYPTVDDILPARIASTPPPGWTDKGADQFRLSVLERDYDGQTATLSLSRAGGSVLDNVNRWRGQVGLPPAEDDDDFVTRTVDGVESYEVTLVGEARAIRGLVVPLEGSLLFVKLSAPADVLPRTDDDFDAFVASLRLG